MENTKKSREWVKTAAIIFLAVLLVLTFFSNTIMNRTLPEVASSEVASGTITAKVRGTGTVSAIGNTEIKATGTTTVASVKVKEGKEVEVGDVLVVMGEQSDELTAAQEELDSLTYQLMRAQNSYPTNTASTSVAYAESALADATEKMNKAKAAMDKTSSEYDEKLRTLDSEISDLNTKIDEKSDSYKKAVNTLADDELAIEADTEAKSIAEEAHYADPTNDKKLEAYQAAIDKLDADVSKYYKDQSTYNNVISEYENLIAQLATKSAEYDEVYSALDVKYQTALSNKESAERSLSSAYESEAISNASNGQSAQSAYIDTLEIQNKIAKAEEKIKKLSGGEDNAITAPVAGTVSTVNVSPGNKVTKDDILLTIEVPDMGYTVSYSVTNDQAKRLKVGDSATVSNYYWGSDITATISSIKVDPKNPQTNKLITFDLDGNVTSGSELTVAVGQKSATYDLIVPSSAVRTDSNGKFVLKIEAKNSALGNRYFAQRVSVEELATDDTSTAISGDISNGDFVITTSSAPISSGDQVRMSDSN